MNEETIPQMRERIERLEKQLNDSIKGAENLVVENKVLKTEKVFGQLGYNPVQAALYVKSLSADDEVTPEGVTKFASEFGLSPATVVEPPKEEESNPKDRALAGFGGGGSTGGSGGGDSAGASKISTAEYRELLNSDPAAAAAAIAQRRVVVGPQNPFAAFSN